MGLTINIYQDPDWGVEHTSEDGESYERAALEAISEIYPGAEVTISQRIGKTRVYVYRSSEYAPDADEVETAVKEILRDVWDAGAFWVSGDA